MSLITTLLGRRLANQEAEGRKIGALEGVPAMGLDGLGSAAYGPEAMLTVLAAVSVLVVPWQLEAPETERVLAEEEPEPQAT